MYNRLKPHIIPLLALLAATFAAYSGTFGHEFLITWDDQKYVTANEAVRGFSIPHLKSAFSSFYIGNYAPLQIVSYMADYTVWGMRAAGFIFGNVLYHALNGLLYYFLTLRLTGRRLWAFLASFIFLLHPVQVESVAWISQRKNVLAMFFFLISFILYTAYRRPGAREINQPGRERHPPGGRSLYACSVGTFLCGLLAKSVAVVLPPLLLLYDYCFVAKERRKGWLADKIPFVVAAVVVALLAWKTQGVDLGGGRRGYHGGSPLATLLTMLPVFVRYLALLVWPANLSAIYTPQIRQGVDGGVALSLLLLTAAAWALVLLHRRRRDLFFWGAAFWIGLLPVAQIVPLVTLMNDRYLYFPMLGAAALAAGGMVAVLDRVPLPTRRAAAGALVAALLVLPFLSFRRAEVWRDSLTLWSDTIVKAPDSPLTNFSLASVYQMSGRLGEAIPLYRRALELDPLDRDTLVNLSNLYLDRGDPGEALPYIRTLVENHPSFSGGFLAMAHYHFLTRNLPEAEAACRRAVELEPRSLLALRYLGITYTWERKLTEARRTFHRALDAGGDSPELQFDMARLEGAEGNAAAALVHLENALRAGYSDTAAVAGTPELASLRSMPEFQALLRRHSAP